MLERPAGLREEWPAVSGLRTGTDLGVGFGGRKADFRVQRWWNSSELGETQDNTGFLHHRALNKCSLVDIRNFITLKTLANPKF